MSTLSVYSLTFRAASRLGKLLGSDQVQKQTNKKRASVHFSFESECIKQNTGRD